MAHHEVQPQQQQRAAPTAPMYLSAQQIGASGPPNAIPWTALPVSSQPAQDIGWVPPSPRSVNIVDSAISSAPQLEALLPGLMCAAQLPGIRASSPRSGSHVELFSGFSPQAPARDASSQSPARRTKKRRDFSPEADDIVEVTGSQVPRPRGRPGKPRPARRQSTLSRSLSPDGDGGSYLSRSQSRQDSARATPSLANGTPSARTRAVKTQKSEPRHYDKDVDLNSADCKTPDFRFVDQNFFHTKIHIFRITEPLIACLKLKECLVEGFAAKGLPAQDLLRLEPQDLHLLDGKKPAYMVLLMDAVHVDGDPRKPVSLAVLLSKGDSCIRWFYTILPASDFLRKLEAFSCLRSEPKTLEAHTLKHGRLFVFLREAFLKAVEYPHHPDYLAAQVLTDYSPGILDPDTALARVESHKDLYFSHNGKSGTLDLENDRYLLSIEPCERFVASDLNLHCSAYLLLKRRFFHAFWRELIACKEKIGDGRRKVRTEHAHEAWLVNETSMRPRVAKRLVVAWRVLGLLEEKRFLPWIKAGGMVEEVSKKGDGVV